jgi:hypothetical protein
METEDEKTIRELRLVLSTQASDLEALSNALKASEAAVDKMKGDRNSRGSLQMKLYQMGGKIEVLYLDNRHFMFGKKFSIKGRGKDFCRLKKFFKRIRAHVVYRGDKTASEMVSEVRKFVDKDHTNTRCIVVVLASHGQKEYMLGTDIPIEIAMLLGPIKGCRKLQGIPTFCIIDLCRGPSVDRGIWPLRRSTEDSCTVDFMGIVTNFNDRIFSPFNSSDSFKVADAKLPKETDMIYAYATCADYVAYGQGRSGSVFIETLCKILQDANH